MNCPTENRKKKIAPPLGGRQRAKRQKSKGLKSWGDTRNPKTVVEVAEVGEAPAAEGRTTVNRVDVPRTAAQTFFGLRTIIIIKPRRILITIMPIVFAPLPNIATHVIQSPTIGLFLSYGMSCAKLNGA